MNNLILSNLRLRTFPAVKRCKHSLLVAGDNFLRDEKQLTFPVVKLKALSNQNNRHKLYFPSRQIFFSTKPSPDGKKIYKSALHAFENLNLSGVTICVGGFGLSGIPETLLDTLSKDKDANNLTIVSLTAGVDGFGLGLLFEAQKVKRLVASYVGENKNLEKMFFGGEIEIELTPQGTIAERMNAAGSGSPAFYTPTGVGTMYSMGGIPIKFASDGSGDTILVSKPRETRIFNNIEYVLEESINADLSIIKAWKADTAGNLIFRGTARNSNPDAAKAGKLCIAEVEEIVDAGEMKPDEIHLPGVYVDRIILATSNEKRIERLREKKDPLNDKSSSRNTADGARDTIIKRAAKEFKNGMYVNLGIGMPTMASNFVPPDVTIQLQAENGLMGVGPYPDPQKNQFADPDWINAGKETITAIPGASTFSSSDSFRMIRGGHVDLTILGGLQVSSNGDLANWIIPGKLLKGMGGAMDLVCSPGAKVVVTMDHCAKNGSPKILEKCTLPLTGRGVVDRVITDMAVFDFIKGNNKLELTLVEIAPGITVEDVKKATACNFKVTSVNPIPIMIDEEPDKV
jgi:3-oxoacid CoA-transferase